MDKKALACKGQRVVFRSGNGDNAVPMSRVSTEAKS
jgi:hypothetical protein